MCMLWRVECIEYLDPCIAHDYVSVWCDSLAKLNYCLRSRPIDLDVVC